MLVALLCLLGIGVVSNSPLEEYNTENIGRLVERHVKRAITADFDQYASLWIQNHGKEVNRQISWFDLYGKHERLRNDPAYSDYKIEVYTESIQYGNVRRNIEQPQQVYSEWFCNNQKNQVMTTTISRETIRKKSFSWSIDQGLKIGTSVSAKASFPGLFDLNAGITTELDFKLGITKASENSETYKIQFDLTVEPQTAVKADWIITELEVEVPYEADIHIDGYIAIWYHTRLDDHYCWFYPIGKLAGGKFTNYGDGLVYKAKGIFRGVKGVDSVIRTSEYSIGSGKCNYANPGTHYKNPKNVTTTKLPFGKYIIGHGVNGD